MACWEECAPGGGTVLPLDCHWTLGHLLSYPWAEPLSIVHFRESAEHCEVATVSGRRAGDERWKSFSQIHPWKVPSWASQWPPTHPSSVWTHCCLFSCTPGEEGHATEHKRVWALTVSKERMPSTRGLREQVLTWEKLTRVSRLISSSSGHLLSLSGVTGKTSLVNEKIIYQKE